MRISLFGTVGVAAEPGREAVVELPHRPSVVLAVLAARYGRTVRDDALIESIWGSDAPATARQALQGYVVAVRNALEPDRPAGDQGTFVVRDSTGYRLDVESDELDLAEFEALSQEFRPGTDERTLDRLIQMSEQPLAADFADADWVTPVRTTIAERRLAALNERFELELEIETGAALLAQMRSAVDEYPYDERLAGSLMTAFYRSGRQAEALAAFDTLRRRLRDELGVSPGDGLSAVHLDLLNQSPSLDLVRAVSADTPPRQVVDESDGLIGRAADIAAVADVLVTGRTVTVVGPGGAGKSTILSAVVRELIEKFPAPIVVDASNVGDGMLLDEIARTVGGDRHPLFSVREALALAFGDRPHLVVIDTCGARLNEVRDVVEALREHASIAVLLASREPVRHRGEHVHRIAGLSAADAGVLLRSLVGAGADVDAEALEQLTQRVDNLPLALEMLAPRIASLGAATVLDEIDSATGVVAGPSSGEVPDRHRSLDALVQWSLDRLGRRELQLLVRCAALHGDFPIDALSTLPTTADVPAEAIASTLAVLVDASLVRRVGDAPATFAVFDTVRDVVSRRFPDDLAADLASLDAHVVTAAWADYTGASEAPVAEWVANRFGSTLDRLLVVPDHQAVMLATAAARRWLDVGSLAQGSAALERALSAVPGVAPPLASIGWTILGFNQLYQGEVQAALTSYRRASERAESVPMDGFVELISSTVAWLECDFDRAWAIASSAVERMTTPSRRAPANLIAFAKSALHVGDLDGAADCYARALQLSRRAGDVVAEANAVRLAAVVQALRGEHDRALGEALRAAALHDAAGSTLGAAQAASTVALVAALSGDVLTASTWSARAIAHARRQFDVHTVCVVLPVIAAVDVAGAGLDRAARLTGWVDHYVAEQQHVRHPTAAALFDVVDGALDSLDVADRRRWIAEGAALSATQMIDLAAR